MKVRSLEIHYLHSVDHLLVQVKLRIFSEPGYVASPHLLLAMLLQQPDRNLSLYYPENECECSSGILILQ